MKNRILLLFFGFIFLWILLIARGAQLQLFPSEKLLSIKQRQFNKKITLSSKRGDILDRNNIELAVSINSFSLYADPSLIDQPKTVARKLSKVLKISRKPLYKKLKQKKSRFKWIKRKLDQKTYEEIKSWKVRGLAFKKEPKRIYPNGRLLSQVLGLVGYEQQGLEGLESRYEDHLSGNKKEVRVHKDARGRPLLENGHVFISNPNGGDIQLTIDRDLQFTLQEELNQAVHEHQADRAYGVVLDAQTSEVLAIASTPTYDNNRSLKVPSSHRRIHSISDAFEPGSTLKTLFVAGALQSGKYKPNTVIDAGDGYMQIGRRRIHEADDHHKFGKITVSEVLARSSNVGVSRMGLDLGSKKVHEILSSFGFGQELGIELPGEAKGILHKPPYNKHLLASISFGHGVTATPLQMASAYSVIANGGLLYRPRIVKANRNPLTGEWTESSPELIRRVIDKKVAAQMRLMMTFVTGQLGTGQNARVEGFPVSGKTGTAQKVNPEGGGYLDGAYISSFAGFLPANDPRFVIYIAIDYPKEEYYGSQVAAPVFSRVAKYAIRKFGLAPVLLSKKQVIEKDPFKKIKKKVSGKVGTDVEPDQMGDLIGEKSKIYSKMPNLNGKSLREVIRSLQGYPNKVHISGKGAVVVDTLPRSGKSIEGRPITLIFGAQPKVPKNSQNF